MREINGYRVGIDIGGTFTDIVLTGNDGSVVTSKVASTPDDYGRAIVDGLGVLFKEASIRPEQIELVVHGTTVATNAILEGKGAKTALITTQGFRDVLELRRIRIPELYNLFYERPQPLVPRRLRFEVLERMDAKGKILIPLDEESTLRVLKKIAQSDVESVAICTLHSYANPKHEKRIYTLAKKVLPRSIFVTCSSEILPEIREYERTSTTVINAYIGPVVRRYLKNLIERLNSIGVLAPLHVMQSNGGIMSAKDVMHKPAYIVESGPAAGVIGAAAASALAGIRNTITIDMGGTTAKAAMIEDGHVAKTSEYEVGAGINISSKLVKGGGHALKLPVIDVSEIGAGGGSIARVDSGGLLSVGPMSAGAVPGPVCYGSGGTQPTLTDAMVVLGYINPDYLVGGTLKLHSANAFKAVEKMIADPLGCTLEQAAHGVFVLAATTMTRAVKAVSTFRGRDPRDFQLFAFGGNGALMAAEIANALDMNCVVVPPYAGLFSAFGLLFSNIEREASRTLFSRTSELKGYILASSFNRLESDLLNSFVVEGYSVAEVTLRRQAELRYAGQAYELSVDVPSCDTGSPLALAKAFTKEHELTYGHSATDEPIDLVNIRVSASATPRGARTITFSPRAGRREVVGQRKAYFGSDFGRLDTRVVDRSFLSVGSVAGPLIIEEYDTTVLVPPGWTARLDKGGNIVMESK